LVLVSQIIDLSVSKQIFDLSIFNHIYRNRCVKQLQVSVPKNLKKDAKQILEKYSSDISSKEAEKNDEKVAEFTVTAESEDIDQLTDELKHIEDMENGDLSIRVIKQESLIRKGQETRGSSSILSQEELYSKAQESADFNKAQWGLVGLSSVIAAFGLASDNLIAVIGAMMLAPLLSPFVSGALSLTVGDSKLMVSSLKAGMLSVVVAVVLSFLAVIPFPVSMNPTLQLVSTPSVIGILLSVFVGAAAALTFVTGLRDEIAGVAVAIALVPPIASIGLGLKMADMALVKNASTVASMNMLAVIISGYLCFTVLGLKPSTYYKKNKPRRSNILYRWLFWSSVCLLLQWLIHRIRAMKTIFQRASSKRMPTSFSAINCFKPI